VLVACTADEGAPEPQQRERAGERASAPGRPGQTFVYECNDGSQFTARVEGEKIWLFLPSATVSLPHVEAASGAKYGDGSTLFWSKGDSAMLERPEHSRIECTNNRRKAIWEDAKLRGADFRATGNEPGWNLELSKNYGIVFVTNYGSDKYTFPLPEPVNDQAARTTSYTVNRDGHELEIVLEGKSCADTMSGEKFETTVTVTFDGTSLAGCGKPLH
jgi:putative lipoprotein